MHAERERMTSLMLNLFMFLTLLIILLSAHIESLLFNKSQKKRYFCRINNKVETKQYTKISIL